MKGGRRNGDANGPRRIGACQGRGRVGCCEISRTTGTIPHFDPLRTRLHRRERCDHDESACRRAHHVTGRHSGFTVLSRERKAHGVHGEVSDFRVDDAQCAVSFKAADAFIDRGTGAYELTVSKMGFAAVVNDLHKGRDSGPVWKAMIDRSAALLTFVSLTGLILIYFIPARFSGLLALAAGAAIGGLVYAFFVP